MKPRRYEVVLSPKAEKQLDELPTTLQRRITEAVEGLESNPRPHGVKKLAGAENLWRIRVGDYRIVYSIEDDTPDCVGRENRTPPRDLPRMNHGNRLQTFRDETAANRGRVVRSKG